MTITFEESFDTRDVRFDFETYNFEATFVVNTTDPVGDGLEDEGDARRFALNNLPLVIDGMPLNAINAIERINDNNYKIRMFYQNLEPLDEEDEEIQEGPTDTFDTTGGTELITHGLERVDAQGIVSKELGAAINYDGERINGVEITTPRFGFTRTIKVPDSFVTNSFKKILFDNTGSINNKAFEFFAAKEVLFLGAVGSKTTTFDDIEDEWTITYNFAGQNSRTDIIFNQGTANEFTIDLKAGWDYIWVQYENIEDEAQKRVVLKAVAAYVIKVYPDTNFLTLGVGL